jgi:hypothetical protein
VQVLINVMIVIPWTLVLLLSLIVNKWQLLFRPLGSIFWSTIDYLDQRMPVAVEWLLWGINQVSLTLHIVTVGINLGVMWVGCQGWDCCRRRAEMEALKSSSKRIDHSSMQLAHGCRTTQLSCSGTTSDLNNQHSQAAVGSQT